MYLNMCCKLLLFILFLFTMDLPFSQMASELKRSEGWSYFLRHQKQLEKIANNEERINFLQKCKSSEIIPKFLRFRIPKNGCFDEKSVLNFQRKLLSKEITKAKDELHSANIKLKMDIIGPKIEHKK